MHEPLLLSTTMTSILKTMTESAHAAVASLLAAAEIKPGDTIPTTEVKENDPIKTTTLGNLTGKNIIVSCLILALYITHICAL